MHLFLAILNFLPLKDLIGQGYKLTNQDECINPRSGSL